MAEFFVIFDRREQSGKAVEKQAFEGVNGLPETKAAGGVGGYTGQLEDACVVKVSTTQAGAPGIVEAQQYVQHFYPGLQSSKPVVVAAAAFKDT